MKFFILLSLLGATTAQTFQGTFLVDIDANSESSPTGSYYIKYDNRLEEIEFVNTDLGCGNTLDYGPGLNDEPNRAQRFQQCEFYRVPNGQPRTCTNDPDLCTNGFTFMAAINPETPIADKGGVMWLYNAGFAKNEDFGFRVGFKNQRAVVRIITSTSDSRIECTLPTGTLGGYFTLAVIRGANENGDIRVLVDGKRIDDCPVESWKKFASKRQLVKYNEIDVGGAKSFGKTAPDAALFKGLLDQLCFFTDHLDISEVRIGDAPSNGCFDIGL